MKSTSELTEYYYKVLHGDLLELEAQRKKLRATVLTYFFILGVFSFLTIYSLYLYNNHQMNSGFFIVAFLAFALGTYIYKHTIKEYVSEFKYRIIAPLIKAIDENLQYQASSHLSSYLFENSQLFKHSYDRYSGNDLVKGSIDNIPLQFSDVHAEYKTENST